MEQEPDWAQGDPELAALLGFTPVPRKIVRPDSWDAACQRGFIAWLAAEGNAITAALRVGRSLSGARQVRREDEAGEFKAAWKGALALYGRRCGPAGPRASTSPPRAWGNPEAGEPTQADADAHWEEFSDRILPTYIMKLQQEREARLAGCIVEADFYVRQLCWFDVAIDLAGKGVDAVAMLRGLKRGDLDAVRIAATPGSLLLDHVRRTVWAMFGEPDRPPAPELGLHNGDGVSTGGPSQRHGHGLSTEALALQAEANLLWEEKARKDAAAWRGRLGMPPLAEGEDDEGEEDGR